MLKKFCSWFLACLLMLSVIGAPVQAQEDSTYSTVTIGTRPMEGNSHVYELLVNSKVVLRFRTAANGYSAAQRAEIILQRVKSLGEQLLTQPISTGSINSAPVILLGDRMLITVTQADWEANYTNGPALAQIWAANLKTALQKDSNKQSAATPQAQKQEPVPATPQPSAPAESTGASQEEQQMLALINEERAKAGLKPLQMDSKLVAVARMKSKDMIDKNYFSHTSPTYGDPFTMMKSAGISFGYAGENLAGHQTVAGAHEALMNSPGHRANILNANYTHIGIGIVDGGPYGKMFTQLFISK